MSQLTHAIPSDPTQDDAVILGDVEIDLDTQIEIAEFNLVCAESHLHELRTQKAAEDAALDAHLESQYQEYLEIEAGKLTMHSDKADAEIAHAIAVKYCEENPSAFIKGERSDPFTMHSLVLVDGDKRLGVVKTRTEKKPVEVSSDIPF